MKTESYKMKHPKMTEADIVKATTHNGHQNKPASTPHDINRPIGQLRVLDTGMDSHVDIVNETNEIVAKVFNPEDSYAGLKWADDIARCVNTHEAQVKMIRVAVKALTELAQNPNRIDVDLYAQGALDTMKDISEALSQAEGKGS